MMLMFSSLKPIDQVTHGSSLLSACLAMCLGVLKALDANVLLDAVGNYV